MSFLRPTSPCPSHGTSVSEKVSIVGEVSNRPDGVRVGKVEIHVPL